MSCELLTISNEMGLVIIATFVRELRPAFALPFYRTKDFLESDNS